MGLCSYSSTNPSGWLSSTSPSGWLSSTYPSGWLSSTNTSGWLSSTNTSGWMPYHYESKTPPKQETKFHERTKSQASRFLVSRFPVFSPRPSFLPDVAWCSQRLLYSVVQFGQTPIHIVSVYLFPNAALGSQKYLLNCKILHWAHQILTSVDAPCVLCGDFNAPLESFETCKALALCGWADLAVLSHHLFGSVLEPTCKNATRHSFAVGNPSVQRFVRGAAVCHLHDLDSHAVQKFDFDVPSYNVPVFKWPQPRALHEFHCNHAGLRASALQTAGPLSQQVREALSAGDATSALKLWSSACEKVIICNSTTDEGEPLVGKRYLGRSANIAPVKRVLSAPRFKPGRKSDFVVTFPSVALKVRQVQKQARRLQSLVRLLKSQFFGHQHFGKVHDLWNAISRSSGFVPGFLSWASSSVGSPIGALPDFETLCVLNDLVGTYANRLASQQWRLKKEIFTTQLEVSMKLEVVSWPFDVLRSGLCHLFAV